MTSKPEEPLPPEPVLCAEEECGVKVYCEGWCHMHFLARFSISTKRAKSSYEW